MPGTMRFECKVVKQVTCLNQERNILGKTQCNQGGGLNLTTCSQQLAKSRHDFSKPSKFEHKFPKLVKSKH